MASSKFPSYTTASGPPPSAMKPGLHADIIKSVQPAPLAISRQVVAPRQAGSGRVTGSRPLEDDHFPHRPPVAPEAHPALLRGVAERVLAVLPIERGIGQCVEELPEREEVQCIG